MIKIKVSSCIKKPYFDITIKVPTAPSKGDTFEYRRHYFEIYERVFNSTGTLEIKVK